MYFHLIIYYLLYSSKHLLSNVWRFLILVTFIHILSIENKTRLVPYEVIIPCLNESNRVI